MYEIGLPKGSHVDTIHAGEPYGTLFRREPGQPPMSVVHRRPPNSSAASPVVMPPARSSSSVGCSRMSPLRLGGIREICREGAVTPSLVVNGPGDADRRGRS